MYIFAPSEMRNILDDGATKIKYTIRVDIMNYDGDQTVAVTTRLTASGTTFVTKTTSCPKNRWSAYQTYSGTIDLTSSQKSRLRSYGLSADVISSNFDTSTSGPYAYIDIEIGFE